MGRLDEAIKQYRKALARQPDLAITHFNLGDAYLRRGNHNRAVQAFQSALAMQPDFPEAEKVLKTLREASGDDGN